MSKQFYEASWDCIVCKQSNTKTDQAGNLTKLKCSKCDTIIRQIYGSNYIEVKVNYKFLKE